MNAYAAGPVAVQETSATPTIRFGVAGPRRQPGFLLRARRLETLVWDLENEIMSTCREWRPEEAAWWIASSYLHTVIQIVLRSFSTVLVTGHGEHDRLHSRDGRIMLHERRP